MWAWHRYDTSRKTSAHDDSIWAVTWPTEDKLITGSIDETVKVGGDERRGRSRASRARVSCCMQRLHARHPNAMAS